MILSQVPDPKISGWKKYINQCNPLQTLKLPWCLQCPGWGGRAPQGTQQMLSDITQHLSAEENGLFPGSCARLLLCWFSIPVSASPLPPPKRKTKPKAQSVPCESPGWGFTLRGGTAVVAAAACLQPPRGYIPSNKAAYAFNALLGEGLFAQPDPKPELRGSCVSQDQTRENVTNANKE